MHFNNFGKDRTQTHASKSACVEFESHKKRFHLHNQDFDDRAGSSKLLLILFLKLSKCSSIEGGTNSIFACKIGCEQGTGETVSNKP